MSRVLIKITKEKKKFKKWEKNGTTNSYHASKWVRKANGHTGGDTYTTLQRGDPMTGILGAYIHAEVNNTKTHFP